MAKLDAKVLGYTRRFNLGNYEHEEFSISTSTEAEDVVTEFARLKGAVTAAKDVEDIPWGAGVEQVTKQDKKDEPKPAKKGKGKKQQDKEEHEEEQEQQEEEDLEEEEQLEEETDEEEGEEESGDDDEEEESEEEADEEEQPKGKKGKAKPQAKEEDDEEEEEVKPKKSFKKKGSTYSRANDVHKKLFVEAMNEVMGAGWVKKNAGRAKTVSIKLEGKDFLDAEGQVIDGFKAQMKKLAKAA